MRLHRLLSGTIVALAVACGVGSATLRAEHETTPAAKQVAATADKKQATVSGFSTLKGIQATPMATTELDAVKGQHVHFLDAGGEKLHLAGDTKTMNNWQSLGGIDPTPVAPSYHGLCVSAGYSGPAAANGISIPGGQFQCPLN